MARIDNLTNFLSDVAAAIKEKKGTSELISARNFDTEILNLVTGESDGSSNLLTFDSKEAMEAYTEATEDCVALIKTGNPPLVAQDLVESIRVGDRFTVDTLSSSTNKTYWYVVKAKTLQPDKDDGGPLVDFVIEKNQTATLIFYPFEENDPNTITYTTNDGGYTWETSDFVGYTVINLRQVTGVEGDYKAVDVHDPIPQFITHYSESLTGAYIYKNGEWVSIVSEGTVPIFDTQEDALNSEMDNTDLVVYRSKAIPQTEPFTSEKIQVNQNVELEVAPSIGSVYLNSGIDMDFESLTSMTISIRCKEALMGEYTITYTGSNDGKTWKTNKDHVLTLEYISELRPSNAELLKFFSKYETNFDGFFKRTGSSLTHKENQFTATALDLYAGTSAYSKEGEVIGTFGKTNKPQTSAEAKRMTNMYSLWNTLDLTEVDSVSTIFGTEVTVLPENIITTGRTSLQGLFEQTTKLSVVDVTNIDTSSCKNFNYMFYICYANEIIGIEDMDTSQATSFDNMFMRASYLTRLDLSKWDTSKVNSYYQMFFQANKLEYLDISSFDFSRATSASQKQNCFYDVKPECLILVKDEASKNWVLSNNSKLTNVKIKGVDEY